MAEGLFAYIRQNGWQPVLPDIDMVSVLFLPVFSDPFRNVLLHFFFGYPKGDLQLRVEVAFCHVQIFFIRSGNFLPLGSALFLSHV